MINKSDCYQLGYIAKLHGFKGEVSLFLDVSDPSEYSTFSTIYIEINGQLIPHFVKSFKQKNNKFVAIKIDGIDSEIDAKTILRKSVYLPLSELPSLASDEFYDHEVVGFDFYDQEKNKIGKLLQLIDLPNTTLIQIDKEGKEILIPFIKESVIKVDRKSKSFYYDIPEGLMSLYE